MGQKDMKKRVVEYRKTLEKVRQEISKSLIGQEEIVNSLLRALIANGQRENQTNLHRYR